MNYIKEKWNKLNKNYLIIILIAFILMTPVMARQIAWGHDMSFHAVNIIALSETISLDSMFLPSRVLPLIGKGFGYGTGIFYPRLAHVFTAYLYNIVKIKFFDVPLTMELVKFIVLALSGITMYQLLKKVFKNENAALVGSACYITTPYMLTCFYIRCAYSEIFTFIFVPMIFLGLYELFNGQKKNFYIYFTIGYIGMINSHLVLAVVFTVLILLMLLIFSLKKVLKKENIIPLLISSVFILLVSAAFLVPLLEHKILGNYIVFLPNSMNTIDYMRTTSLNISDFFREIPVNQINGIVYHLNYFTLLLFIYVLFNLKKIPNYDKNKKFIKIILFFIFLTAFMSTKFFPWQYMPSFMQMIQFPFRMLSFLGFGMSVIAALSITNFKEDLQNALLPFILFGITLFGFNTIDYEWISYSNISEDMYRAGTGAQNEYFPVNVSKDYSYYNNHLDEVVVKKGKAKISNYSNDNKTIEFDIDAINAKVELPRIYYLGYQIKLDGKKINYYENSKGFIEFKVNGKGHVTAEYTGTTLDNMATIISFAAAIVGLYLLLKKDKNSKKFVKNKKK